MSQTVTILSGSSRSDNNTMRLGRAMQRKMKEKGWSTNLIDFRDYDIPFMNQGSVSLEGDTPFQRALIRSIDEGDMVIIMSPEYNWFPTAELINMLHQLGNRRFGHLFDQKVFAMCGLSTGRGGRVPAMQLSTVFEKIVSFLHKHSMISPKKFEAHYITMELDDDGHYTGDGAFEQAVDRFLDYNIQLAVKFL